MMTKQKEIREGFAEALFWELNHKYMIPEKDNLEMWNKECDPVKDSFRKLADHFLKYLHSKGVVIEIPKYIAETDDIPAFWTMVYESLIEEKSVDTH